MRSYQMFINGEFIANESRKMISVINPATEAIVSDTLRERERMLILL